MKQTALFVLALTCAPLLAAPALAQIDSREGIALQNQIRELQAQVSQLRAGGGGGGYAAPAPAARAPAGASDLTAQLLDRVAALEEQVRSLRGRVESQGHALEVASADLSKKIGDLDFRLQALEGGRPAAPGAASAPALAAPAAPAKRTAEVIVAEGNAALAKRDYAAAEAAGREAKALKGPRGIDGQFILAQALAGQKNWPAAAVEFNDTYDRSRTGPHAEDSLLGLANALVALKEPSTACQALAKLRAEFPNPRPDLREPIAGARARAGCR